MGLYEAGTGGLYVLTTADDDPLAATHGDRAAAWRGLDVAVLQHLVVEQVLQPAFGDTPGGGRDVKWKFPHTLEQLKSLADGGEYQLGVVVQPTPLAAVRAVSEAGELMPPKSTFFYPKLATGFVINPLA
jgi:uncharacterized protein (DUF1015 family)